MRSQIAIESPDCHTRRAVLAPPTHIGWAGGVAAPSHIGWAGVVAVHLAPSAWFGCRPLAAGETLLCGVQLDHTHTSELFGELVSQARDGPVDLDWLLGH